MGALLRGFVIFVMVIFPGESMHEIYANGQFERKMIIYSLLHSKNIEILFTQKMCLPLIWKMFRR